MDVPAVRVSNLVVKYRDVAAVDGVSIDIRPGRLLGLVGESGCGKSTLGRAILGLGRGGATVESGRATLSDGRDLMAMTRREWRSLRGTSIGFIPQNPFAALHPTMRIEAQFRDLFSAHGLDQRARTVRSRASDVLESVGLENPRVVLGMKAHELSGGMAQRVVMAMALLFDPMILVADEPTASLDTTVQRRVLDLIRSQTADRGLATLLITHDLGVVAQYCDDTAVMYGGNVVEIGRTTKVLATPAHPYTRGLISAVPTGRNRQELLLGKVRTDLTTLGGCRFVDRCAFAMEECERRPPELISRTAGHFVACFMNDGRGLE